MLEKKMVAAFLETDLKGNPHIESKNKIWKRNYNTITSMLMTSEFGFNETNMGIEVESNNIWEAYLKAVVNVLLLVFVASSGLAFSLEEVFDVTQYGAVGDGETDDTQAFLKAWNAICGAPGDRPTLYVPAGKTFFLNPLAFTGPCTSSLIQIQIDGNLVAPSSKGEWKNCEANTWIVFNFLNGLIIRGVGTLDAKGAVWWKEAAQDPPEGECLKPHAFRLSHCNKTHMEGLRFLNSGGSHIKIDGCNDLHINKIHITAPEDSDNTDGIDISDSRRIQINNSYIATGDDCIAINNNCFNVNITGIACGPGHGISIGSLGKDGREAAVDGIYVRHCTFTKTQASARIKTWPGGSGYAKNILYKHITLNDVESSIEINQYYSNNEEEDKAVEVSGVHFINVQGTAKKVILDCSKDKPCQEIYLQEVNIASSEPGKEVNVTCKHANVETDMVTPPFSCTE